MVSLAVAKCIPLTVETATNEGKSLRDSACWHPQIPGTDLYLNYDYFKARDTSITRYQPLLLDYVWRAGRDTSSLFDWDFCRL